MVRSGRREPEDAVAAAVCGGDVEGAVRPLHGRAKARVAAAAAEDALDGRRRGARLVEGEAQQLLSLTLDQAGTSTAAIERIFGGGGSDPRLRSAVQGPDGALYVATANGSGDRIFRLTPS